MSIRDHIKTHLRLAIPVMLSNLGHILIGVTDNIMVGHVNAESLAAAGLALVAFNVVLLFGIGVSYAITPLVASADGAEDVDGVIQATRHGLVINVINSVIMVGVVFFASQFLYKLDQPQEVVTLAIPFLNIITVSMIPILIFQTFKQFAEGLGQTQIALVVMVATMLLNILFNYAFVYGHFGFPAMGLEGSGWATLTSRVFMAIAMVLYIYHSKLFHRYRGIYQLGNYSKNLFKKLLHLGIPSGVQFIFEVAAFDFSLVMMGWLGTNTQAAHQIAINMATMSYMTTAGLAAAATIRVGYYLGNRDWQNLKATSYTSLLLAMTVMFVWGVIFIAARNFLPSLYVSEPEVISIASSLLVIAGLFQLADGAQVVCASALRGLQDVKIPSLFILISYWVVGLPLGYLLAFKWGAGADGIWWGLLIGLVLTAVAMFIRLRNRLANPQFLNHHNPIEHSSMEN